MRRRRRAERVLLAPLRLLLVVLHLLWALPFTRLVFPQLSLARRNRILAWWSRGLLRMLGVRLEMHDVPFALADGVTPGEIGRVLLANHVSWVDIFAINAVAPARFVAKSDILAWPLLGQLVRLCGTVFVERGRRHAVHAVNRELVVHLGEGETVGLFPEGTTGDGSTLLPFHANLLQAAVEAQAAVVPVALRYLEAGQPSRSVIYVGDTTLVQSLWRVVTADALVAEVRFLPALALEAGATRQELGLAAQAALAASLGIEAMQRQRGRPDPA